MSWLHFERLPLLHWIVYAAVEVRIGDSQKHFLSLWNIVRH